MMMRNGHAIRRRLSYEAGKAYMQVVRKAKEKGKLFPGILKKRGNKKDLS